MPASLYVKTEEEDAWQRQHYPHRKIEDYGKRGSFPAMGMPNAQASSGIYYAYKLTVFEGGTRIPMLVKMPGNTQGQVVHAVTHIADLYPTFVEFAGGGPQKSEASDRQLDETPVGGSLLNRS